MIGTLSTAGLSAIALNATPVAHSQPAPVASAAAAAVQPTSTNPDGWCHVSYWSNDASTCGYHFGWHHRRWAAYLWYHYGQSGQQAQLSGTTYAGLYGHYGMYSGNRGLYGHFGMHRGMYGYGGQYGQYGMYGRHDGSYTWGNNTWTPNAPATVSAMP
jgi:hypothetical protein